MISPNIANRDDDFSSCNSGKVIVPDFRTIPAIWWQKSPSPITIPSCKDKSLIKVGKIDSRYGKDYDTN